MIAGIYVSQLMFWNKLFIVPTSNNLTTAKYQQQKCVLQIQVRNNTPSSAGTIKLYNNVLNMSPIVLQKKVPSVALCCEPCTVENICSRYTVKCFHDVTWFVDVILEKLVRSLICPHLPYAVRQRYTMYMW